MKAVVLVGGEGTRMRPLTETVPKPLLPLMDRPSLDQVLDHLARHGVHEVVLSSPYLEDTFHPFIEARHGDPRIVWITEPHALGTGGAIVHALDAAGGEPFFALNGDILTDLDLTALRAFHEERGAAVTIALHHVEDARAFGLVATDAGARVIEFREKPELPVPEREIFPAVIERGRPVFGFLTDAYWLDLGTPEKYLQAHFDMFEGKVHGVTYPAPWVAEGAGVDLRAHLGRWVAVGPGASVGPDARVEDSVLHGGSRVEARARITESVLAADAAVGEDAVVEGSVVGEGGRVPPGMHLVDARVSGS